jgi:Na+/H+-dicarboxylate symporter
MALAPPVATLVKRGMAGRFAASVIAWIVFSSALAGLLGVVASSLLFRLPFSTGASGMGGEVAHMFTSFLEEGEASLPLLAILGAVILGFVAVWIRPLFAFLGKIEKGITGAGHSIGYVLFPLILCFGITIGIHFGAKLAMSNYLRIVVFTALLCLAWWLLYVFVIMKVIAKQPVRKLLTEYYLPTAVFAGGTCSSLATLPVNLANIKKYGVRDEVADFVIPFGAVANMDGSALAYIACTPLVLSYGFGVELSWTMLLIAWPALVLFTIAAPGLPAGMGTPLWCATLFASMTGLEDPVRTEFIATYIALLGVVPDMFITTTNCTDDGFTAVLFDRLFDRFFSRDKKARTN